MQANERDLFAATLREAATAHRGGSLDDVLAPMGWSDAYEDDPRAAVPVLFELQGELNASSSALAAVVGSTVLPLAGGSAAPASIGGPGLVVRGLGFGGSFTGETIDLVASSSRGHQRVTVSTSALTIRAVDGIDPSLGLVEVSTASPVHPGAGPLFDWPAAVSSAQLALAHQLVGAARAMLSLARDHAVDRVQGGRAIASYQAVRHRLADSYVAVQAASSATTAAWEVPSPLASTVAKLLAGRAARLGAGHAQQVLGAMGFTEEHVFHHYLRRVLVLDELFGSARALAEDLGRQALETKQLPQLLPL